MKEIWKDIPGYEGRYQVSSEGNVRSLDRFVNGKNWATGKSFKRYLKGHLLKPGRYCSCGHVSVILGHKAAGIPVHRLVMLAFVGPPLKGQEVRHKNGNPKDNRLDNLEYGTRTENILDVFSQGKAWRKLTIDDVQNIRTQLDAGALGTDLANQYGVCPTTISSIKNGRTFAWLTRDNYSAT